MKKSLLFLLLIFFTLGFAQDSFDEWLKAQNQDYLNWKSQQDKEFTEFLKHGWDYYKIAESAQIDSIPKPEEIPNPIDQINPDLTAGKPVSINKKVILQPDLTDIVESINRNQMLYAVTEGNETVRIDYWGIILPFSYNKNIKFEGYSKYDSDSISDFWSKISNTDYEDLLQSLKDTKDKIVKNDWGYCQLVYKLGKKLYQNDNMANLFTWFVLTKNGYDCKVGYDDERIYLMLAVKSTLYNVPRLVLEDRSYYAVCLGNDKYQPLNMYTYAGSYPKADDLIDLSMDNAPNLKQLIVERNLLFEYQGNTWNIPVKQNKTLIEFLNSYPSTDLDIYFNSQLSPLAQETLVEGLKPIIEGKTETEALNILLHFVQTSFKYQTDDQQFGSENSLFPDETLFYDYCDCEDRSFLFSLLVKELLRIEVIGLDYPGHIATAVGLDYAIEGDKIAYNGRDYLICDPTYINANIGVVMPQFIDVEPRIIDFR